LSLGARALEAQSGGNDQVKGFSKVSPDPRDPRIPVKCHRIPDPTGSGSGIRIPATRGIGHFITSASQFLATDFVFVGIGIIAACAFAFSFAMRLIERWLVPWKGKS